MKHTVHAARESDEVRQKIEEIIGMPYRAMADVKSFLEIFNLPEVMDACKEKMVRSLKGLKVACYYGCLTSRPREVVALESTENPMMMDNIVAMTGAEPIVWDFKTECCGAAHQVDAPVAARPLIERIFKNAKASGAKAIITACPLCNLNLDMRVGEINKNRGTAFDIPVYQFTQLLAVCMGASANEAGLHKHFYPAYDRINDALRKAGEAV
jgi:heterodisulfide reductase subunit B